VPSSHHLQSCCLPTLEDIFTFRKRCATSAAVKHHRSIPAEPEPVQRLVRLLTAKIPTSFNRQHSINTPSTCNPIREIRESKPAIISSAFTYTIVSNNGRT